MFDLASNTKMYAANFALQRLVSQGKLDVYQKSRLTFLISKTEKAIRFKEKTAYASSMCSSINPVC